MMKSVIAFSVAIVGAAYASYGVLLPQEAWAWPRGVVVLFGIFLVVIGCYAYLRFESADRTVTSVGYGFGRGGD